MANVAARGHDGDGREDPPHPGGRPRDQHEQDAVPPLRKRTRGKSKNLNLAQKWKKNGKKPLPLEFDKTTFTPVGEVYDLFVAHAADHITREIPLDKDSWKDVPDVEKNGLYTQLMTYFDIQDILEDPEKSKFREGLESVLRSRYTCRKAYVKRHFVKMGGYEDLERVRDNRPVDLSEENWDKSIRFFTSEKHMRLSAQNKINKAKQVVVYRGGRCSYSNACHKLNKSRVEAFGDAHRTKDGKFDNPISEAHYKALVKELDSQTQPSSSSSTPTPVNEVNAFEKVLGARRGIIIGIGHKPSSSSTSAPPVQEQSSRRKQPSKLDIMLQNPEFRTAMEEAMEDVVRKFTAENDDVLDNENGDENNDE